MTQDMGTFKVDVEIANCARGCPRPETPWRELECHPHAVAGCALSWRTAKYSSRRSSRGPRRAASAAGGARRCRDRGSARSSARR